MVGSIEVTTFRIRKGDIYRPLLSLSKIQKLTENLVIHVMFLMLLTPLSTCIFSLLFLCFLLYMLGESG